MTKPFELGREVAADGAFVRQESAFRRWVRANGSSGFPAATGRYHLYVCLACPWSHRAVIVRRVKGLEGAVSMSLLDPFRDARGWAFSGGEFHDPVSGFSFLSEAYVATDPGYSDRVTVPVLWDRETRQIVSNESADIVRMFNGELEAFAERDVDLYPAALRREIDELNGFIYENVNDGVYQAGFARSQQAYDRAYERLFVALDRLETILAAKLYLTGDAITEADWRLFPTLVRFDAVYYAHFKCNRRRLVDYPNLWGYTRDLYQRPGIAETVAMDQIKLHYYTTHGFLNPSGIVPLGPEIDFEAPHDRARLSAI
jgi:putative glutathione S-transferase